MGTKSTGGETGMEKNKRGREKGEGRWGRGGGGLRASCVFSVHHGKFAVPPDRRSRLLCGKYYNRQADKMFGLDGGRYSDILRMICILQYTGIYTYTQYIY